MIGFVQTFLEDETGATALEYGLMVALLSIVVVTAATGVFNVIAIKFNKLSSTFGSS